MMNRQQKKNYLKRQQKLRKQTNAKQSTFKSLADYKHENEIIQNEVRQISTLNVDPNTFHKQYVHSVKYDFVAILFAELFSGMLKDLRKETSLSASELDLKLGYSVGYCYASFANTANRPTSRNVKISFEIFERMKNIFPKQMQNISIEDSNQLFDLNKTLEKALFLNGYDPDWKLIKDEYVEEVRGNEMDNKIETNVINFTKGSQNIKFQDVDEKSLKMIQRLNDKFNLGISATKEVTSEETIF